MNSPSMDGSEGRAGAPAPLEARGLKKHFIAGDGSELRILQGVELRVAPGEVVAVIGASGVGKSTLARQLVSTLRGGTTWFDLENPVDQSRLADPGLELRPLRGFVVLDEIHRLPDLFPLLRVLADRPRTPARFLVLGSASPELLRQTSETLAGRVAFHELDGFGLREVEDLERLWLRGGFPLSYLARSGAASRRWRGRSTRNERRSRPRRPHEASRLGFPPRHRRPVGTSPAPAGRTRSRPSPTAAGWDAS